MRAVVCKSFGPPETLVIEEIPERDPGPDEIRIAVHAAGVNPNDALKISGAHHDRPQPPFCPGSQVAGVVTATGVDVKSFRPGDRVMAILPRLLGGWAEHAVTSAHLAVALPPSVDFTVGSGFFASYVTAYDALVHAAEVRARDTVLVTGAGGNVGYAAVEIATLLGARVIAVAGHPETQALARAAGAQHVIDHHAGTLREEVLSLTAGRGVDVVIEVVGGDLLRQALRCIAWRGRFTVTGFISGDVPEIRAILMLLKCFDIRGANLSQTAAHDPAAVVAACKQLFAWYSAGKLRVPAARGFAFDDFAAALRHCLERRTAGKVFLSVAPPQA
jgi:NADPH2:quinone reductase